MFKSSKNIEFFNPDIAILHDYFDFDEDEMEYIQAFREEIVLYIDPMGKKVELCTKEPHCSICEFDVEIVNAMYIGTELINKLPVSDKLKSDVIKLAETIAGYYEFDEDYWEDSDLVIDERMLNR